MKIAASSAAIWFNSALVGCDEGGLPHRVQLA
jgi:hypothetical protein